MVFVEEDSVVVHTSGVTTTTRMLTVLADTTMAGAHVTALLPVLLEAGRHFVCEWWRIRFSELQEAASARN